MGFYTYIGSRFGFELPTAGNGTVTATDTRGGLLAADIGFSPGDYAGYMLQYARDVLATMADILEDLGDFEVVDLPDMVVPGAPVLNTPLAPILTPITYSAPALPSPLTGDFTVDTVLPDAFDEDSPEFTLTTPPTALSITAPTAPAVTTSFDDPGELVVGMPAAPALLGISIHEFDGITLPEFTEDAPTIDLIAPSMLSYSPGAAYSSSLMTLLQSTLYTRIHDGGTGLPAPVENAIWERGYEREQRSAADAISKLEQMEAMGFAFPPGVYIDARLKVATETDAALKGHSREVMIKQAELEQTNILKAIESGIQLEGEWLRTWDKTEQRRFEAIKFEMEGQISLFNARVSAFQGMTEAYKAKISAYEARIRAETTKVDVYRAQVAAEQAKAQVNDALVQQYKVQSDIALSAIEIYKAKVDSIKVRAEIERLKIDVFRGQIEAYVAQQNGFTAQVEAYKALVGAEAAKQDAFKARVQAYAATVEAAAKSIDAEVAVLKARIDAKQIEYEGYKAAIQGETARIEGLSRFNDSTTERFKAEIQGSSAFNDALVKEWAAQIDFAKGKADLALTVAKANAELRSQQVGLMADVLKAQGSLIGQIGAAALSAYNISASSSVSGNTSYSRSSSDSTSRSESVSESRTLSA